MAKDPRQLEEERRKLFRRMEWLFVYGPPLLAVLVAVAGGTLFAFVIPIPGLNFWGRLGLWVMILFGVPGIAYLIRDRWKNR